MSVWSRVEFLIHEISCFLIVHLYLRCRRASEREINRIGVYLLNVTDMPCVTATELR